MRWVYAAVLIVAMLFTYAMRTRAEPDEPCEVECYNQPCEGVENCPFDCACTDGRCHVDLS
jgi:hypothetical protein